MSRSDELVMRQAKRYWGGVTHKEEPQVRAGDVSKK